MFCQACVPLENRGSEFKQKMSLTMRLPSLSLGITAIKLQQSPSSLYLATHFTAFRGLSPGSQHKSSARRAALSLLQARCCLWRARRCVCAYVQMCVCVYECICMSTSPLCVCVPKYMLVSTCA